MSNAVRPDRKVYFPSPGMAWNPLRNFPVNESCFCGSGKKFKKCHRLTMAECVDEESTRVVEKYLAERKAGVRRVLKIQQRPVAEKSAERPGTVQMVPVDLPDADLAKA